MSLTKLESSSKKQPYIAPKLKTYGHFSQLTAAGSGIDTETGTAGGKGQRSKRS